LPARSVVRFVTCDSAIVRLAWATSIVGLPATPSPFVIETFEEPAVIVRADIAPVPVRETIPLAARPATAVRSESSG
jgi:hypothetical protein